MFIDYDTRVLIIVNHNNPEEAKLVFTIGGYKEDYADFTSAWDEKPFMDRNVVEALAVLVYKGLEPERKKAEKQNKKAKKELRKKFDELEPFSLDTK